MKKLALWGSVASIAGLVLALYLSIAESDKSSTIIETKGDNSPAIGSNEGTINISNTYTVKNKTSLPIEISKGIPYEDARKALIAKGWQPIAMHTWPNLSPVCWSEWADEESCKFEEINSCAGSGMGFCLMYFHDGDGEFLMVRTVGGSPPDARIDLWSKSENPPEINVRDFK